MNRSRGTAEISLELYDRYVEMEKAYKKHMIMLESGWGGNCFYSRDEFEKMRESNLRHRIDELNLEMSNLKKENDELKKPVMVDHTATIKSMSIFDFIRIKRSEQ